MRSPTARLEAVKVPMGRPENDASRALVLIIHDDERVCQAVQELAQSGGPDAACSGFAQELLQSAAYERPGCGTSKTFPKEEPRASLPKAMTGSRNRPKEIKPCLGQPHLPAYRIRSVSP